MSLMPTVSTMTDFVDSRADPEPSLFPSPLAGQLEKRERLSAVLDKLGLHRGA